MAFYTGEQFPKWKGNLFVGALRDQMLVRLVVDGEKVAKEERLLKGVLGRIRDVRNGPDGFIYLLTDESNGLMARLEPYLFLPLAGTPPPAPPTQCQVRAPLANSGSSTT